MFSKRTISLTPLVTAVMAIISASSFADSWSGTYQITSGTFTVVGGFDGSSTSQLPNRYHAFVQLVIDPEVGSAELAFFQEDWQPSGQLRVNSLTNGVVSDNSIQFQYETVILSCPGWIPATVDYTVTNVAGDLLISGSVTSAPRCFDYPSRFVHEGVQAVPISSEFFWDQYPDHNGWKFVDDFGWVYPFGESGWAYHLDLDYIYSDSTDGGNVWFYRTNDWIWTNLEIYPFLWSNEQDVWLYFDSGGASTRFSDPEMRGIFRYLDSESRWYWERYAVVRLHNYEIPFDRKLVMSEDVSDYISGESGTIEYVFNIDDIVQYLKENPRDNGEPYLILDRIGQSEFETVHMSELSQSELRELVLIGRVIWRLKRDFNLRIFYNGSELSEVEIRYSDSMDQWGGSRSTKMVLPDGNLFYYQPRIIIN
jgi:hypothetical protein